jgi:hypothetical protein
MIDNSYVNDLRKLKVDVRYIRLDDSTLSRLFKNGFFDQKISDVKKQLELQRKIQFDQNIMELFSRNSYICQIDLLKYLQNMRLIQ